MFISLQSYHHDVWAIQKEIKDAYPRRYDTCPQGMSKEREREREREKMHTQRRYATCPQGMSKKKKEKKKKKKKEKI